MKRFLLLLLAIIALAGPTNLYAQDEFRASAVVNYDLDTKGRATITNNITLTNVFSNLYAVSYTLTLEGVEPVNPRAREGNRDLQVETKKDGTKTELKVTFPDQVVGKGARRRFQVIYEEASFAIKTGEVWEVVIPKLGDTQSFDSYEARLLVPAAFGNPAYISPAPVSRSESGGKQVFVFDKDLVTKNGVTAAFGSFQVFSFDLTYHLENPLNKQASVDVAIPPDTAFQRVNYAALNPAPAKVYIDNDGNWLATYKLAARQRVDVKATGTVQIFSNPVKTLTPSKESIADSLAGTDVWQIADPQISELGKRLKTPKQIYDYVVSTLSYDYERVRPNVTRLGAKQALQTPTQAICMEFTDTFVALARAAGIPAREVNGYAYTENPQIQPLSLVADVLHSWPEYWDEKRQVWVPVDPTWESTTGGIDYFNKLDLRHFTFVIHGKDAYKPYPPGSYKLGANPQKDVFISFGSLPDKRISVAQISAARIGFIPFGKIALAISVKNPGPVGLYDENLEVFFDDSRDVVQKIEGLPVGGVYQTVVDVPYSFLGDALPNNVTVLAGNVRYSVPAFKPSVIIVNVAFVFGVIFAVSFVLFVIFIRKRRRGKNERNNPNIKNSGEGPA